MFNIEHRWGSMNRVFPNSPVGDMLPEAIDMQALTGLCTVEQLPCGDLFFIDYWSKSANSVFQLTGRCRKPASENDPLNLYG